MDQFCRGRSDWMVIWTQKGVLYYMKAETKKVEFRNFNPVKILHLLIELLAEQEGVEIEYTIEKVEEDIE